MTNKKMSADMLQQELERLRNTSRLRNRRLQHAGALIVSLSLVLFLVLWLYAAKAVWDGLHAPIHVAVIIGMLAAALQRLLGITVHSGRFRGHLRPQPFWGAIVLLCGAALILLAG